MSLSRRTLLKGSSAAFLSVAAPFSTARAFSRASSQASAAGNNGTDVFSVPSLLADAISAARGAGAVYVDARYQEIEWEGWGIQQIEFRPPIAFREYGIGVRALYNGYWGYASRHVTNLTSDIAAALGREATAQAKTSARGRSRSVDLVPAPVVANGTWTTPIEIDPFTVSWDEKLDFMDGVLRYASVQYIPAGAQLRMQFTRQRDLFSSTDGSQYDQTLYHTDLGYRIQIGPHWRTEKAGARSGDSFANASSAGWEAVIKAPFEQETLRMIAQANDTRFGVPAEVGRYDIVCDGAAVAKLASLQLGAATELDRAMGYLANRDGTSYINDPLGMLGTHTIGSPLLNVTANRSMPKGAATVQWDDEGVVPDEAVLIQNGVLTDFQTTRESAAWLAARYQKMGKAARSHGGATRNQWMDVAPQQGPHNLVIAPSAQDTSFEALCSGVKKGLAVLSGQSRADQQMLNAESTGDVVYEINNGKLGRVVEGAIVMTRAPELWKKLNALGGVRTVCPFGMSTERSSTGMTAQTVSAPAALFTQIAVTVDNFRVLG